MAKFASIIVGAVLILIGVVLFFAWTKALVLGVQFSIMALLILGGLIALVAGLSEMKDTAVAKKESKE